MQSLAGCTSSNYPYSALTDRPIDSGTDPWNGEHVMGSFGSNDG